MTGGPGDLRWASPSSTRQPCKGGLAFFVGHNPEHCARALYLGHRPTFKIMTQIPRPVSNFLATITVPGAFAQATGFKVMAAVRLKLAELAQLPGNPLLNADELDDAATG